jgi:hypothetical protein
LCLGVLLVVSASSVQRVLHVAAAGVTKVGQAGQVMVTSRAVCLLER